MTEMKHCPFCGSRPEVFPRNHKTEGNAWGEVRCENRRCPTYDCMAGHGVSVGDGTLQNDERGSAAYKAAAIRRWNRRATPDPTP